MTRLTQEMLYQGRIFDITREQHRMPDGRASTFEFLRHPGGCAVLPVMADGRLLLIRQFRPAIGDTICEIPAGRLEPGEDPATCVRRELVEEVGYHATGLESLGFIYSSIGFCDEKIYLFVATDLEQTETALEPDEFIEPLVVDLPTALAMITAGEIPDAKTQAALLRYALNKRS